MRQKIIAGALGVGLLGLAAVGAFASQDFVHTQADPTNTATATATDEATVTDTATVEATETETPEAAVTPDASESPESGERDIKGIPTTNANFHEADGDGVCDHGESVVKTTPAGTQVNVPCEATEHGDSGHGHDQTPEAAASAESEHSSSD